MPTAQPNAGPNQGFCEIAPRTRNVAVSATYSTIRGTKTIALNTQVGCY